MCKDFCYSGSLPRTSERFTAINAVHIQGNPLTTKTSGREEGAPSFMALHFNGSLLPHLLLPTLNIRSFALILQNILGWSLGGKGLKSFALEIHYDKKRPRFH